MQKTGIAIKIILFLALLTLVILVFSFNTSATISIDDVSPVDDSCYVAINDNPPDPGGYVNLSVNLSGNDPIEFVLDVYIDDSWVNRLSDSEAPPGVFYQDEFAFNTTGTTYMWRVHAYNTSDFTWNNQTFSFTTKYIPDAPSNPNPADNITLEGNTHIILSVDVYHMDDIYTNVHNVSFYHYPSGNLIGYNYSATGWNNGTTVRCNTSLFLRDTGQKYYWYAKAKDTIYWSDNSSVFLINTYYNDTCDNEYGFLHGYINVYQNHSQPDVDYNFLYGYIAVYNVLSFHNPSPHNVYEQPIASNILNITVECVANTNIELKFQSNDTGSWEDISSAYSLTTNVTQTHPHPGFNEYNKTYYWRVMAYVPSTDKTFYSDVYSFTTKNYTDTCDIEYGFLHGYINVYQIHSQPDVEYNFLYGNITVSTVANISNPSPFEGETDVYYDYTISDRVETSVDINASTPKELEVTFESNKTGSWVNYHTETIVTNQTVTANISSLPYGERVWWRVTIVNHSTSRSQTETFNFTLNDEPIDTDTCDTEYGFLHGYINVYQIHSQPDVEYNFFYGDIKVGDVNVSNPYPSDGSTFGQHAIEYFSCYVIDMVGNDLTVTFYDASTDISWYTDNNVPTNTRAEAPPPTLTNGSLFTWYVTVDNEHGWNITSSTWSYTPENSPPSAWVNPDDGDTLVQVNRMNMAGEWRAYVKLLANLSDIERDDLTVKIYIDDPDLPDWDDWIMRLSHVDDTYSYYNTTLYRQDELLFNDVHQEYSWRIEISDGFETVNYYMNFTTEFYFWAYYRWIPSQPTNEDTITLIDESVNATTIRWYANNVLIAEQNYTSGTHEPFNVTRTFNISNVYNISQWIYNETCGNIEEVHAETSGMHGYMHVDRNVTINSTNGGAGYNYIPYHINETINASTFADLFGLQDGWWMYKYDKTNNTWLSYWLYLGGKGNNFNINTWDVIIVSANQNQKTRVNISDYVEPTQSKTITSGYNYVSWSDEESTTSQNLSIGLSNGDWIYKYDTVLDVWHSEWVGMAGDDFDIYSYDALVISPADDRNINVG